MPTDDLDVDGIVEKRRTQSSLTADQEGYRITIFNALLKQIDLDEAECPDPPREWGDGVVEMPFSTAKALFELEPPPFFKGSPTFEQLPFYGGKDVYFRRATTLLDAAGKDLESV